MLNIFNHKVHLSAEKVPRNDSASVAGQPVFKQIIPRNHSPEPGTAGLNGGETVLLVEDEPSMLMMTRELLVWYGYTVLTAADGMEAMAVFKEHRDEIQLAVIDLGMPRMTGQAAIEQIRQHKPYLPVILTTGYSIDMIDSALMDARNILFMQKPVDYRKLATAIRAGLMKESIDNCSIS